MVEVRGRKPYITPFEEGADRVEIERGMDIEIRVDTTGHSLSSVEKMYLSTSGLEQVVRNGDQVYFEGGLRCMVVDVGQSCFTIRAKNDAVVTLNESVKLPEKHSKLPIIKDDDITDIEYLSQLH